MSELDAALARAGLDIAVRFDTAAVAMPWLADPARRLGVLVGNSRALWPAFRAALAADSTLAADRDPLDRYVEHAVDAAARELRDARVYYVHRTYDGAFLPFRQLAVATGLGSAAPTGLVIHPTFGPWFALRAVIAYAGALSSTAAPAPAAPLAPVCRCDGTCERALAIAQAATGPERWRAWVAVREACTIGRDHRYSDDQIAFHYTKNRALGAGT